MIIGGDGGSGIVGVGVDAVSVDRFRRLLERRPRFVARCFTEGEQSDAGSSADRAQSLAARRGQGGRHEGARYRHLRVRATDVEVRRTGGKDATRNAPYVVLTGTAAELAGAHGAGRFHLSLTHTDEVAIAFVVAEQAVARPGPDGMSSATAAAAASAGSAACAPS